MKRRVRKEAERRAGKENVQCKMYNYKCQMLGILTLIFCIVRFALNIFPISAY
jgi:hypothetical protein